MVKSTQNGTIMIAGDSNIDLLAPTEIQKRYIEVLETYDLNNHITKANRIGEKIINHIISSIPANRTLYSNVLPCPTINDHDAPYTVIVIEGTRTKLVIFLTKLFF